MKEKSGTSKLRSGLRTKGLHKTEGSVAVARQPQSCFSRVVVPRDVPLAVPRVVAAAVADAAAAAVAVAWQTSHGFFHARDGQ